MKIEQKQLLGFLARLGLVVMFASLYAIGGSGDFWGGQKWIRRFLAPGLLCGGGFAISLNWRSVVFMPLMMGALTLPYGAEKVVVKFFLRFMDGSAYALAYNGFNLWTKQWLIAGFGITATIAASVIFGVWNPFANPMLEQGFIGTMIALPYVMGLKRRS